MLSCLLMRDFAATVLRLHNPALRETPLLIVNQKRGHRIVATSAAPRRAGVRPGMTARQASLLCPEAGVEAANDGMFQRQADALAEGLLAYANRVEREYQPTQTAFYLDTTATTSQALRFLARQLNVPATLGTASNKLTVRVAALRARPGAPLHIPPGQEAAFLASQPITLLPLSKDMARRLPLLGIHSLGAYAALPEIAAWEQFGQHGRWLHRLANGVDLRPLIAYAVPPRLHQGHDFDDGITDAQVLQAVLRRLASDLVAALDGQQAGRIALWLTLSDRHLLEAHHQPARPVGDWLHLTRRLVDLLAAQPVNAPVQRIDVQLSDLQQPQPRQLSLFDALQPERTAQTALPEWLTRHRETDFFYGALMSDAPYALPEDRFDFEVVRGA